MFAPVAPGLLLIQADGLHDLEENWHRGDAGDPFPGSMGRTSLGPTGSISTSFPGQPSSGITLSNIRRNPTSKAVTLSIKYDGS